MARVLITGGTGLVGTRLKNLLEDSGFDVLVLSRDPSGPNELKWDWEHEEIDIKALEEIDHVIHLAGDTIGKPWTKKQRRRIMESRVRSGLFILRRMKELNYSIKSFICASATGYYGLANKNIYTETDEPGNDFLAQVCLKWEEMSKGFSELGARVVVLRTGVVISDKSQFIRNIRKLRFDKLQFVLGSGEQFVPWIHLNDLCHMYLKAITNLNMKGVYNAVAPEHITHKQMLEQIPPNTTKIFVNIPQWLLRLALGKMSDLVLGSCRVSCHRIQHEGYGFIYPRFKNTFDSKN